MGNVLSDEIRVCYEKVFGTISEVVADFPNVRWLAPHGDDYYLPCRIAYHIAVVLGNRIGGVTEFPWGRWIEADASQLPEKAAFLPWMNMCFDKAREALSALTDEDLTKPGDKDKPLLGTIELGRHLTMMREISAHTGELNKMRVEDGLEDIWK